MIRERISGSKKNIIWIRRKLLEDPTISVERISAIYPEKDLEGRYYIHASYNRKLKKKVQRRNREVK
ncbi:MAG: hypothetical protein IJT63_05505 [Lachnospiraceae bacterium]|nr:hypothetical protein [Lachnospiraceae bacterium]